MFSNLGYEDKEAFFSLLDEYFASRPHLLSSSSNRTSLSPTSSFHAPSPTSTTSTSGRTLPPVNRSPAPPLSSPNSYSGSNNNSHSGEKPDMATRLVSSGLKLGTAGARTGLNMLSKNQKAMDAIGRAGANAMVAQAQSRLGGSPQQEQQEVDQGHGYGGGGGAPPAPAKKSGMGGFANKGLGMFKGSREEPSTSPSSPSATRTQAPPARQTLVRTTEVAVVNSGGAGQAQALYDYEGADSGDLSVQANQIVNVVEKTSADWWTCEDGNGQRGLVPASYLQAV